MSKELKELAQTSVISLLSASIHPPSGYRSVRLSSRICLMMSISPSMRIACPTSILYRKGAITIKVWIVQTSDNRPGPKTITHKAYALVEERFATALGLLVSYVDRSSLSVEARTAEDEALSVARVAQRTAQARRVFGDVCLMGRDAFATIYTVVVSAVLARSGVLLHTTTKGCQWYKGFDFAPRGKVYV
jgi:hypothetical protein